MKKYLCTVTGILFSVLSFGQIGINTMDPKSVLHIDGKKDNLNADVLSVEQQSNDFVVTSQGHVGVKTTQPDSSAVLDMKASDKGFLPPRVFLTSNTDSVTIPKPATGLTVFHTGSPTLEAGLYSNVGTPSVPSWNKGGQEVINENQGNKVYKTPLQPLANYPDTDSR